MAAFTEVEAALDTLDRDTRARQVLASVARLSPEQVDDVLPERQHAGGPGVRRPAPEVLALVSDSVVVTPYVDHEVHAAAETRQRRRRAGRAASAVVGLLVVLALVPLVVHQLRQATGLPSAASSSPSRTAPVSPLPDLTITKVTVDPDVPVSWYAAGRLHLGAGSIRLADVVALRSLGDLGVVVAFADGRLARVSSEGEVVGLGRSRLDGGLATEADEVLVAWLDRDSGELVVRDLAAGADVAREPQRPGSRVLAVDSGLTYVTGPDGYSVVHLGSSLPERHDATVLLDVSSGAIADAPAPGRVRIRATGITPVRVAGIGAELSDDGRYAVVREPPDAGARSSYAVIDVQMGTSILLALPDQGTAVDAAVSAADSARQVMFVIAHRVAPYDLIACDLPVMICRVVGRSPRSLPTPLLAR